MKTPRFYFRLEVQSQASPEASFLEFRVTRRDSVTEATGAVAVVQLILCRLLPFSAGIQNSGNQVVNTTHSATGKAVTHYE
jgi:hypothetical protein